jgi:hypothetical protein
MCYARPIYRTHGSYMLICQRRETLNSTLQEYSLNKKRLKISQHCASGKTLANSYNLILSTEIMLCCAIKGLTELLITVGLYCSSSVQPIDTNTYSLCTTQLFSCNATQLDVSVLCGTITRV